MPGVGLRVRAPQGDAILGPGEEGILEVVSPRMGPEWIRTSDIAVIDSDGFLFHRGRADGAIMRGGFKLLPETIEHALLLHPAISAAGVVGVADSRVSEVPAAAIQLKSGAPMPEVDDLEAHLRLHLPSTHIPAHWRFVDTLPKNASFKIDRPGLKRLFEDPQPLGTDARGMARS
jgi:acyl-CoA synthetase (AMP-forming)/AMP-acid ligase II